MTTAAIDRPTETGEGAHPAWDPSAADAAAAALEEQARGLVLEALSATPDAGAGAVLEHVAARTSPDAAAAALVGLLASGQLRLTGTHRLHVLRAG